MPKKKAKKKPVKRKKAVVKLGKLQAKKSNRKTLTKKTVAPKKKTSLKTKTHGKKKAVPKTTASDRKRATVEDQGFDSEPSARQRRRSASAGQSGDLQGLSRIERADSESVDELIEEGNAFEAEVVTGVERAGNSDEKEVRTQEVPEDDVPGEYLDKD